MLFGSLVFGNFGQAGDRPITPVAQHLDLGQGVSATLFLRHHYVDINSRFVAHCRRCFWCAPLLVFDQIAQDNISHGEPKGGPRRRPTT